jgi:thiamine-monophosphate kinase
MNERDLISSISHQFAGTSPLLLKGIGDDCAVIAESDSHCWLVSTDLLVENIHFKLKWHAPFTLGRKAIAVNLSDIATMGGVPRFVLLSVVLPTSIQDRWLQEWRDGVKSMLDEFSCILIGGDVSKGERLTINVTVIGTAHPDLVLYRSGATGGQDIYVTGKLGSSAAGLELLKKKYNDGGEYSALMDAHLNPIPQIKIGINLAKSRLVTAMQDISDGIATDLGHICKESNVSAVIDADKIPIDGALYQAMSNCDKSVLELALFGGEDYQLVFISDKENSSALYTIAEESSVAITKIGETMEGGSRVLLLENGRQKDISFRGYEHI